MRRRVVVFILCLVSLGLLGVLVASVQVLNVLFDRLPTCQPEPTYSPEFVQRACADLSLDPQSDFCSNSSLPVLSTSYWFALHQTYPVGTTTYEDLEPILIQYGESSRCRNTGEPLLEAFVSMEGCPPPDTCGGPNSYDYLCYLDYGSDTEERPGGVLSFSRDGVLLDIFISRRTGCS